MPLAKIFFSGIMNRMEEQTHSTTTAHTPASPQKKPSKRLIYLIAFILVVVVLGLIGWRFMGDSSESTEELTPTPTEFQIPTDTPEPSPTPEEEEAEEEASPTKAPTNTPRPTQNPVDKTTGLDRSELSVEVLNGSGVSGAAAKAAENLRVLGYSISKTGNADNSDYTNTTIEVKSSSSEFLSLLKKDLSGSYTIGTTSATFSGSADARVIIGKN